MIQIKRKDFMKNLVELSQQELGTVSGGKNRGLALAAGILCSGPWFAPIACLTYSMHDPSDQSDEQHIAFDYGDLALASVTAFGIHIAEIAAIYGIGKGLKKLFSSSKRSKETKNI